MLPCTLSNYFEKVKQFPMLLQLLIEMNIGTVISLTQYSCQGPGDKACAMFL